MRAVRLWLTLAGLIFLQGCAAPAELPVEKVVISSALLGKDMISQIYVPEGYEEGRRFPVLYYMGSGGGSSYTVVNQFGLMDSGAARMKSGEIEPMILVALGIDFSFGMDMSQTVGTTTIASEQEYAFAEGPYESYILREAIPYIDAHYPTLADREHRFIGGYSMGGFAALHLAFRNPELFSKAGGHSPTLFTDVYVTPEITAWMFPDEAARAARDPMRLAETRDLTGLQVYLDTGPADVNVEGCQALHDLLTGRGVESALAFLPGAHGYAYCRAHMAAYLRFYGTP